MSDHKTLASQRIRALNEAENLQWLSFHNVTRVTVVTDEGLELDHYDAYQGGVDIHLQDDGRTLKIFPKGEQA